MKQHPSAIIHPKAKLDSSVEVGSYSNIGANVTIGKGVKIGAFCVIEGNTAIADNCHIFTGAVVGSIPQDLKYKGEKSFLKIGKNNIVREYVTMNLGTGDGGTTQIGDNNLFMAYSHIAHDCIVGNDCIIANCGTLAGHVTIEDKAVVGGLVAIHQFVKMGQISIVGGCSKVVQDIPPYSTCDGHPTKVYGLNLIGLKRAGIADDSITHLKHAFKILFRLGLTIGHALERIEKELPQTKEISHLVEFLKTSERGICR
ncbi:MAG: acyl-ACP--UDP-N-acetylglucosamine O-acyltransferase [Candidatus Omnitrophota bacterium]|nr:acyl-ACP--UDP-N-acetylglucosamine O-acyltransferase [Candidatus Omnitrophota bacterium]